MKCPRCGANIPSGAKSCGSCGVQLAAGQYCPHCGKVIPKGSQKCPKCGRTIPQPTGSQPAGARKPLTKRWWFWAVCTLLVVGILGNLGNALSDRKSRSQGAGRATPPPAATAAPSPTPVAEPTASPSPTPEPTASPSPTPSPTPAPQPTEEPTPLPTKAPAPKPPAPDTSAADTPAAERKIYITRTGKKYHYDDSCNGGTYIESSLDKAIKLRLTPCKKCVG